MFQSRDRVTFKVQCATVAQSPIDFIQVHPLRGPRFASEHLDIRHGSQVHADSEVDIGANGGTKRYTKPSWMVACVDGTIGRILTAMGLDEAVKEIAATLNPTGDNCIMFISAIDCL